MTEGVPLLPVWMIEGGAGIGAVVRCALISTGAHSVALATATRGAALRGAFTR